VLEKAFQTILHVPVAAFGADNGKITRHCADVPADGHFIIVENDGKIAAVASGVVESLIRKAAGKRAVADDGNHTAVSVACQFVCTGKPQRGDNGGTAVAGAENIHRAFVPAWKTGKPVFLPQRRKKFLPSGKQLVCIALMANVPDNLILRKRKNAKERDGELHNAQIG